jgi:hypothetical protein
LIEYSDSCPAGLGGYSNQGFACCFKVPNELLFRATNNLLEYLAVMITPWIDLINGQLNNGDCALSMTDSSTAKGWMRKTTFIKTGDNKIQAKACINAAQHHAPLFMNGDCRAHGNNLYGQWRKI